MRVTSDAPSSESGEAALWEPRYHRPVVTGFFSYSLATSKKNVILSFLKLGGLYTWEHSFWCSQFARMV